MIPHQSIGSPLSSLLISLFGGAQGRGWRGSMLVLHILQRQKPDPMEKTSHTIKSRCACVWNFSGWNSHPFLHDSIFYFEIWANFLFLFSFPFFFVLLGSNIFFLLHSPYLFAWWRVMSKWWSFFFVCGWKTYFCVTSSVEVSMSIYGVYVILILKAWNESHKGRKQFDKAQCKTSSICVRY